MFPWSGFGQGIGLLLASFCGGCAGLEAEAVVSSFEDVAVVGEAIEQSRRHLGVAEHPAHSLKLRFVVMTTLVRS